MSRSLHDSSSYAEAEIKQSNKLFLKALSPGNVIIGKLHFVPLNLYLKNIRNKRNEHNKRRKNKSWLNS